MKKSEKEPWHAREAQIATEDSGTAFRNIY